MNQRLTLSQPAASPPRKGVLLLALAVLLLTQGGLRIYLINRSEVIAEDGAYYLGITKDIAANPAETIRECYVHPGYPVSVIGTYSLMRGGQLDPADREGWERAGQAVALTASLLLLVGVWAFAWLIFGNWWIGFIAAMLFGFGRKFAALGADVLTDSLMLCLQVWTITLALAAANSLSRKSWRGLFLAAGVGALAGGAFLVRPEGLVVLAIAVLLWLAVQVRRRINWTLCLAMAAVATVTAFVVMWPYMQLIGTVTRKWNMSQFASSLSGGGAAGFSTCLATIYPVEYPSVVRIIGRFFEAQHPVLAGLTCAYILLWLLGRIKRLRGLAEIIPHCSSRGVFVVVVTWLLGRIKRLRGLAEIIPHCSSRGVFVVVVTWILIAPLLTLRYRATGAMSHRYLMLPA
ncbi:MAG: hypothetical protein K8S55_01485, partial [Phycisphaerae bacterium]|nr:hypothetical protein [Phycisphaerae bacterium]